MRVEASCGGAGVNHFVFEVVGQLGRSDHVLRGRCTVSHEVSCEVEFGGDAGGIRRRGEGRVVLLMVRCCLLLYWVECTDARSRGLVVVFALMVSFRLWQLRRSFGTRLLCIGGPSRARVVAGGAIIGAYCAVQGRHRG